MSHNIINFLKNNNNKTIKDKIITEIAGLTYACQDKIGEGYFGKVYTPLIPNVGTIKLKNNTYTYVPVAVKEMMHEGIFDFIDDKERLYLYSDRELTCEAILLYFISKFWYESKFPYAPFLISVHKCKTENHSSLIDHLVTERHGVFESYQSWSKGNNIVANGIEMGTKHKLETFYNMLHAGMDEYDDKYNFSVKSMDVKFNLIDMIDNLMLHTLIYMDYCTKHGLILVDQHLNNIFISWITDVNTIGGKKMLPVKNIYYTIGKNEHIKAPVNIIIPKVGDLGSSVLKMRNDLWIVTDLINVKNIDDISKLFDKYVPPYLLMFDGLKNVLPYDVFTKTLLKEIYDDNKIISQNYSYMTQCIKPDKFPTESQLLKKYYKKYLVSDLPKDSETVFIVKD